MKSLAKSLLRWPLRRLGYDIVNLRLNEQLFNLVPEISEAEAKAIDRIKPYTMGTYERLWAMVQAVHHVNRAGLGGDIVECGVWRGGNVFLARAIEQAFYPNSGRRYFLYDTFTGMSEPTAHDSVFLTGESAAGKYEASKRGEYVDWCYASYEDVHGSAESLFGDTNDMVFVKGMIEQTLEAPENLPERIALLRLDTDWYESTRRELEVLYPRLVDGGVLIIDDYGRWKGAKQAVDEYFGDDVRWLHRVDYACRLMVK